VRLRRKDGHQFIQQQRYTVTAAGNVTKVNLRRKLHDLFELPLSRHPGDIFPVHSPQQILLDPLTDTDKLIRRKPGGRPRMCAGGLCQGSIQAPQAVALRQTIVIISRLSPRDRFRQRFTFKHIDAQGRQRRKARRRPGKLAGHRFGVPGQPDRASQEGFHLPEQKGIAVCRAHALDAQVLSFKPDIP
jgi:hypothetical protein